MENELYQHGHFMLKIFFSFFFLVCFVSFDTDATKHMQKNKDITKDDRM